MKFCVKINTLKFYQTPSVPSSISLIDKEVALLDPEQNPVGGREGEFNE
jgi:hypothetical protein